MALFKCKMCGGELSFQEGSGIAECPYCGTKQTLPKLQDEKIASLYERANYYRRNNEFDKAAGIFEQILNEDNTDSEVYWSLVLCRYGIEYVEDPKTKKQTPTVHRAQYVSIFEDEDFKSAIKYADAEQKVVYETEAKEIDSLQKSILSISQKEEPFDVFICYKETDEKGDRTQDSVIANDLYDRLTAEGFKVFFSRITLEDKLGTAYEPYIFAALNSAKVMVVIGTKPEYFNAVWVRNEWNRYLDLIKNGEDKTLIPAYKDMDASKLPSELAFLQSQDMAKLGFMQDLTRGIIKLVPKKSSKAPEILSNSTSVDEKKTDAKTSLRNKKLIIIAAVVLAVAIALVALWSPLSNAFKTDENNDENNSSINNSQNESSEDSQIDNSDISSSDDIISDYDDEFAVDNVSDIYNEDDFNDNSYYENDDSYGMFSNDNFSYLKTNHGGSDEIVIVQYIGTSPTVEIPASIDGGKVSMIDSKAFAECTNIKSVTIPNSVVSIADKVFYNCKALETINIPNSVTYIGDKVFYNCESLKSITLPNSIKHMGEYVFSYCSGLTSATLPNGLTSISKGTFERCYALTSITIPDSVTNIGISAFVYCDSLSSVKLGNGVKTIDSTAFHGCSILTNITIPNGVTKLADQVFSGCEKLQSIIIPDSVTSIGYKAFGECYRLKSVTLPTNLKSIEPMLFQSCRELTSVTIPSGVEYIDYQAFDGCTSLTSIVIPDKVTKIGEKAFDMCWSMTSVTLGKSVKTIENEAFDGCTALKNIKFPNTLTSIGVDAFSNCGIESITIPDSVTSIGVDAFYDCTNLKKVYFHSEAQKEKCKEFFPNATLIVE